MPPSTADMKSRHKLLPCTTAVNPRRATALPSPVKTFQLINFHPSVSRIQSCWTCPACQLWALSDWRKLSSPIHRDSPPSWGWLWTLAVGDWLSCSVWGRGGVGIRSGGVQNADPRCTKGNYLNVTATSGSETLKPWKGEALRSQARTLAAVVFLLLRLRNGSAPVFSSTCSCCSCPRLS